MEITIDVRGTSRRCLSEAHKNYEENHWKQVENINLFNYYDINLFKINKYMNDNKAQTNEQFNKSINYMAHSIINGPCCPTMRAYRGLSSKFDNKDIKIGSLIPNSHFICTSLDKDYAKEYMDDTSDLYQHLTKNSIPLDKKEKKSNGEGRLIVILIDEKDQTRCRDLVCKRQSELIFLPGDLCVEKIEKINDDYTEITCKLKTYDVITHFSKYNYSEI